MMTESIYAVDVSKVSASGQASHRDEVAVEEPLEIRLAYSTPDGRATRSISITMRTPGRDHELAAGFLYGESIIRRASDIASIEDCGPVAADAGQHNVVRVELRPGVEVDLGRLQRHFYTSSSCGVCGKASLDALRAVGVESIAGNEARFGRAQLSGVPARLLEAQATFERTGGLHAAAAFTSDGALQVTMEDVGRHNAVDKVIGALLQQERLPATQLGLIVSGRASFELTQKALVAGIPLLAAVSAPSSLAVRLADEFGMTLVGFLRGNGFNIYTGGHRIQ